MDNEELIRNLIQELREQRKTTDKAIVCIEAINSDNKKSEVNTLLIMAILTAIIICIFVISICILFVP